MPFDWLCDEYAIEDNLTMLAFIIGPLVLILTTMAGF